MANTQDITGEEVVTNAIMEVLNDYPGLDTGEEITFSELDGECGIVMYPTSGAIVQSSVRDIVGHTHQVCAYPFTVIYRAAGLSEGRRIGVKQWLDILGEYLEGLKKEDLPELTGGRLFIGIDRNSAAAITAIYDNGIEDWSITATARYSRDF